MRRGRIQREMSPPPALVIDTAKGEIVIRPRKALLDRKPATVGRVAAFDRLHRELAAATELYLHLGDGGREGIRDATVALFEYLTSRGIPPAALEHIVAIQAAIDDADRGIASPVFKPRRRSDGGKPPTPDMQLAFDGKLALVMECCVRHCRAAKMRPYVRPAANLAADLINKSDWAVKVTARQLEELRERIQQRSKGSVDRASVDMALKSGVTDFAPLEWAKALLADGEVNPPAKLSGQPPVLAGTS